jgi:hypothetical protein
MGHQLTKPDPVCPACGKPMRFARSIPAFGALAHLEIYQCLGCGVILTEAAREDK